MSNLPFLQNFSLEGRTALVTGGTRGLGSAMTIALAEAGADVVLVQRDTKNTATKEAIEKLGRKCTVITADMSSEEEVSGLTKRVLDDGHDISILLPCAGIQRRLPAEKFSTQDWNEVIQVNLSTVFILCRDVGAYMLTRPPGPNGHRGSIINIGSLTSFVGGQNVVAYAASKGGIAQMTKAFSNEWASRGVVVNAIAPGYVHTELTDVLTKDPDRNRQILDRIPAGRWGRPDDFKGVVVFLASQASLYISGTVFPVDGGWMGK